MRVYGIVKVTEKNSFGSRNGTLKVPRKEKNGPVLYVGS